MTTLKGSQPTEFTPESRLLLACARVHMDTPSATVIRELAAQSLDWPGIVRSARRHGVAPLLYRQLDALCADAVPGQVLADLRLYFHDNARHSAVLTRELLRLIRLMGAEDVEAVPLKGPVLAMTVYGSLALRKFDDVDILVHHADLPRWEQLLRAEGYKPLLRLSKAEQVSQRISGYHNTFVHATTGVIVELHWAQSARKFGSPLATHDVWRRLTTTSLAGTTVACLPPEDLLVSLCIHGSRHLWVRLEWICGIGELVRAFPQLRWDEVLQQARSHGSLRMVRLGLILAHELLGAQLPLHIWKDAAGDSVAQDLALKVRADLFGEWKAGPGFEPFHWRMRERWRDRLGYLLWVTVTPSAEDWEAIPLPTPLLPLYAVLRPLRLVGKYSKRLWG